MKIACDIESILNKDVDLALFLYLQHSSNQSKTDIAKHFGISGPTLYSKINILNGTSFIDVQEVNDERLLTLNNDELKIYIFLSLCHYAHHITSIQEIGDYCGLSTKYNYQKNYNKINNAINILQERGLILLSNQKMFIDVQYSAIIIDVSDKNKNILTSTETFKRCSYGENKIIKLLNENNIPFVKEKIFNCLKDKKSLRYDFFVNNSYIIEFDGKQHFDSIEFFGGEDYLKRVQYHDMVKNDYAKKNNIPIIRIPYTEIDNLTAEDIMIGSRFQLI